MKHLCLSLAFILAFLLIAPNSAYSTGSPPSQPMATDPDADADGDGLTNQEEAEIGTLRENAYSDGDTVMDGLDAIPTDGDIDFARSIIPHYAVIELPANFHSEKTNAKGLVLGKNEEGDYKLWNGSNLLDILLYTATEVDLEGEADNVDVYLDDNGKLVSYQYFRGDNGDDAGGVSSIYQFNGTAVVKVTPKLNALSAGHSTYVIGVNPGGVIYGRSTALAASFVEYTPKNNQPAYVPYSTFYSPPTVWSVPTQPEELKGYPGTNDIELTMNQADYTLKVHNTKGIDDHPNIYKMAANGKMVGGSWEHEATDTLDHLLDPPLSQRKYYGLVWPDKTSVPTSLGENAVAFGISDLNIAVGYDGETIPSLWLEKTDWKRKDLPLYEQKPGDLSKIPVAINSKGLILLDYTALWANGFTYDIAKLAGQPEGTISASQLTESGIMLGQKGTTEPLKDVLLVPAEIEVKKLGDTKPPQTGLAVKKNDVVEIKLNNMQQSEMPVSAANTKWFKHQLKMDGTYTAWEDMGATARGVKFNYTCATSGIFQLKCEMTVGTQTITVNFVRKRDELKTSNGPMGPGKKGQPDSFGVCDIQKQVDIRSEALRFMGSVAYESNTPVPAQYGFPAYPESPEAIRCNIFVAHRGVAAGASIPKIGGVTHTYPPLANQWAGVENCRPYNPLDISGPTYALENWSSAAASNPQPGFIIAHPDVGENPLRLESGHCAIIDYDGGGIGAGTSGTVNKNFPEFFDGTSRWRQYEP